MKKLYCFVATLFLCWSYSAVAQTFKLDLDNGEFFGPGHAVYNETGIVGVNRFVDAEVRNIVLTGPLTGFVQFFNNGADEPNVIAEKLQNGGIVDGLASDGTLINENGDTALRLNFSDPATGESADVMVIPTLSDLTPDGSEPILPDNGNLTFNPTVVADPADPTKVVHFKVVFTTGAKTVPLSLKTQKGLGGGVDSAGPLKSGRVIVGRLGDYDQDGFLDGKLVQAENAPLELVVGRGNPIAQKRPWTSNVPVSPDQAAFLTLHNLLTNYPQAFEAAMEQQDFEATFEHLQGLDDGILALLGNFRRLLPALLSSKQVSKFEALLLNYTLHLARLSVIRASSSLDRSAILSSAGKVGKHRVRKLQRELQREVERAMKKLKFVADRMNSLTNA